MVVLVASLARTLATAPCHRVPREVGTVLGVSRSPALTGDVLDEWDQG